MNSRHYNSRHMTTTHSVEQTLAAELDHFKRELSTIDPQSRSEHDVWYRGLLERMIARRSQFIACVFHSGRTARYA